MAQLPPISLILWITVGWILTSAHPLGAQEKTLSIRDDNSNTDQAQKEYFDQQVVPLLKQHCYGCHSHQANQMESDLALDWRSGWSTGGSRGPAIIPGKPEESLLIQAVRHQHAELKMPEQKLSDQAIETLVTWVRSGAWDDRAVRPVADPNNWWSLKPLIAAEPPSQSAAFSNSSNPIDIFIEDRLAKASLQPSQRARPADLLRRVFNDLIGLPPSIEQMEQFELDPSQVAYEEVVDQLLNSPRYGERWARHWLDTIHFAESHGYEHDVGRDHAWPYRDYVITALNSDIKWSNFIRQQLAVDYFEPSASHLTPALGFLGAGTFDLSTYSTGPVTFDYLDRDDMLTQTMAAFVSTTANCARCHAHKFDPITQEDYYALQAVFAGVLKGDVKYDQDRKTNELRAQFTKWRDAAMQLAPALLEQSDLQSVATKWMDSRPEAAAWQYWNPKSFVASSGTTLTRQSESEFLASGANPDTDIYTLTGDLTTQTAQKLTKITAMRLEVLPHNSLPMNGPGRNSNGNLHLSEISVVIFVPGDTVGKSVVISQANADFNQVGWGIERAIDGDAKTAWGIHPEVGKPHQAVFEFAQPVEVPADALVTVSLQQLHGRSHLIGAFRVSFTDDPVERTSVLPASVESALKTPAYSRTAEQRLAIFSHAVAQWSTTQLAALPPPLQVFAIGKSVEIPSGNGNTQMGAISAPKPVHLLQRGDIDKPQDIVPPGALSALNHSPARFAIPAEPESLRRAALADWIAHPDNVLTWRSVVNRVWHYHFGRGLCDTPSDFGRMGGVPSHPELIDWLAIWFRDQAGQSSKNLHRLIVTSHTYQQSSQSRAEADSADSSNRLLWRQNRRRLDADAYRDWVMQASGMIDLQMGGPSVQQFTKSPGPQSTPVLDYAAFDWSSPGANRRSIYRYVWRGIADPFMAALDFPDLGLLAPERVNSNSALQALELYNNSFVLHFSQQLANRLAEHHPNQQQQVEQAVMSCLGRRATAHEKELMTKLVEQHGLANLCRVLFNSSEFVYVP